MTTANTQERSAVKPGAQPSASRGFQRLKRQTPPPLPGFEREEHAQMILTPEQERALAAFRTQAPAQAPIEPILRESARPAARPRPEGHLVQKGIKPRDPETGAVLSLRKEAFSAQDAETLANQARRERDLQEHSETSSSLLHEASSSLDESLLDEARPETSAVTSGAVLTPALEKAVSDADPAVFERQERTKEDASGQALAAQALFAAEEEARKTREQAIPAFSSSAERALVNAAAALERAAKVLEELPAKTLAVIQEQARQNLPSRENASAQAETAGATEAPAPAPKAPVLSRPAEGASLLAPKPAAPQFPKKPVAPVPAKPAAQAPLPAAERAEPIAAAAKSLSLLESLGAAPKAQAQTASAPKAGRKPAKALLKSALAGFGHLVAITILTWLVGTSDAQIEAFMMTGSNYFKQLVLWGACALVWSLIVAGFHRLRQAWAMKSPGQPPAS